MGVTNYAKELEAKAARVAQLTAFKDAYDPVVDPRDESFESLQEIFARSKNFLYEHSTKHQKQTVMVSTHNVFMNALLMGLLHEKGQDLEYDGFDLKNCAVMVVKADKQGNLHLVAINGFSPK